jgi:hypothetical protein
MHVGHQRANSKVKNGWQSVSYEFPDFGCVKIAILEIGVSA